MPDTPANAPPLSSELVEFIARWGEAARRWGLTRSAGRVHGLLLTAEAPMTADEIAAALGVARSNVSTSLKELRDYGVVRPAPGLGDRKERYAALDDPWEAAANIAAARRAREFDPARAALADAALSASGAAGERLAAYRDLAETVGDWAAGMDQAPKSALKALMKAGGSVAKVAARPKKAPKKKKKK